MSIAKAPQAAGPEGDIRELAKDQQEELRLWNEFPRAMMLIKKQSEVYHAAEEDAAKGKVFIYPIIAAFGQDIGAAEPSEEEIDKRMRLVELLAVVDRAPEPKTEQIFNMISEQFGLCPKLGSKCTDLEALDAVHLLERMHDIGEYLQLEKRLCKRVKQLLRAEGFEPGKCSIEDVKNDKELGPLLTAAIDKLVATAKIPDSAKTLFPGLDLNSILKATNLRELLLDPHTLQGALGWSAKSITLPLMVGAAEVFKSQMKYILGMGIGGYALNADLLALVKADLTTTAANRTFFSTILVSLIALGSEHAGVGLLEALFQGPNIPLP